LCLVLMNSIQVQIDRLAARSPVKAPDHAAVPLHSTNILQGIVTETGERESGG
jgi:hypothetical protein